MKEDYSVELKYVVDFYHDDFNESSLSSQLQLLVEAKESQLSLVDIIMSSYLIKCNAKIQLRNHVVYVAHNTNRPKPH